jgi:hypothetical protein
MEFMLCGGNMTDEIGSFAAAAKARQAVKKLAPPGDQTAARSGRSVPDERRR